MEGLSHALGWQEFDSLSVPTHKPFSQTAPIVGAQFVATQKRYYVRTFKGPISFVERGLERLGLGYWTAISHGFYRNLHEGESDVSNKTFFWGGMSGSGL